MQCLSLPEEVLTEVNTIIYKFMWKKKYNNKKAFEKVRRNVVNSDYDKGGLTMIDIRVQQHSLL